MVLAARQEWRPREGVRGVSFLDIVRLGVGGVAVAIPGTSVVARRGPSRLCCADGTLALDDARRAVGAIQRVWCGLAALSLARPVEPRPAPSPSRGAVVRTESRDPEKFVAKAQTGHILPVDRSPVLTDAVPWSGRSCIVRRRHGEEIH